MEYSKVMKLYNVPRNSKIVIVDNDIKTPPASLDIHPHDVLTFKHIDGMYSLCYDKNGDTVHIVAWTEVKIIL